MANVVIRRSAILAEQLGVSEEELKHYGVLGMKWGVRKSQKAIDKLTKQTDKVGRVYARGKKVKEQATSLSQGVRQQKYKLDKKIRRAQRWLDKGKKADVKGVINRYNRSPEKRQMVQDYMHSLKKHTTQLDELRLQLIDMRV